MKSKIKRALKSDLVKSSFFNGIANFIGILTSIISNKVVAVYLGPAGIALLGQFSNFLSMAMSFSTLGVSSGITKYVAEYKNDPGKNKKVLSTALIFILSATAVVSLVTFLCRDYFSRQLLHSSQYSSIFLMLSCTLIFFALNAFFTAVLNGFKEFKKIVSINIITSVVGLIIAIALVIKFGLYGAFLGTILSRTIVFGITVLFLFNLPWIQLRDFISGIDRMIAKKLLKYSLMAFTSVFAVAFIQLQVRNYIISHISLAEAGYWQGVVRISDIYLSFITSTLGLYYLPRLSEITRKDELLREIKNGYLLLLPLTIISSITIYLLKDLIINVLYASSFANMTKLFLFQLIGNVLKIASWILGYLMIAKAMTRLYIITEIVFGILYYLLTVVFVSRFGTIGATYSYALNYLFYLICLIYIFKDLIRQEKHGKLPNSVGNYTNL